MKINEIQIKGFKAIGDLSLQPKGINVLVGRNGTGKTSVLEAVFYAVSEDVRRLRAAYASRLSSLVNSEGKESSVVVKLDDGDGSLRLSRPEIVEVREGIRRDVKRIVENSKRLFSECEDKFFYSPNAPPNEELKNDCDEAFRRTMRAVYDDAKLIDRLSESSVKFESKNATIILIDYDRQLLARMTPLLGIAGDGYDIDCLNEEGDLALMPLLIDYHQANPALQIGIEFIESLWHPSSFGKPEKDLSEPEMNAMQDYLKNGVSGNLIRFDFDKLLFKNENGEAYEVPYASMGSGFQAIAEFVSRMRTEHRIILIEEPENHMHPEYVKELLIKLVDFARRWGVQFFMTTNSRDVLEFLACDDLKPEYRDYLDRELNVIRMEKNKESVMASQFNRKDAKDVIEKINSDLRGI